MARQLVSLGLGGGWNTELGPIFSAPPDQTGRLMVPWLVTADNLIYSLDGWPAKMPGAGRVNATATGATDHVIGIFDYWKSNSSGAATQRKVIFAGTSIYSEAGAGTLTAIKAGIEAAKMPWAEVMNDLIVLATTSTTDVPWKWNQTTFADLGGTPPNFSFHVQHKDRMFAAGVESAKSRLYYCAQGNPEDWVGAGSGSIDVRPDDGDTITALASHRNELLIWKGPARGAILRLTGSTPSDFALVPYITGVGATNQQALLRRGDDLLWWDHRGIHSLVATNAYGDYVEGFVSAPIRSWFTKALNHGRFDFVWGANFPSAGYALWTATLSGSSTHDVILGWDYRFDPPRFFRWPAYPVGSIGMVLDTNQETVPWFGTYTGRVWRGNRVPRDLDMTSYTFRATWPRLDFGSAMVDKTAVEGRVGFVQKNATFTLQWQRDDHTPQSVSITQAGGGDLLGDTATSPAPTYPGAAFDLDVDSLVASQASAVAFDMEGQFKELQIEISQGSQDIDCEPHSLTLQLESAGLARAGSLG